MKSLLLLLAVGFAAGTVLELKAGQEYRYRYVSQISSGIPHFAEQYAGQRYEAICTLQMKSERQAIVKMEIQRLNTIKTELKKYPEDGLFPDSSLEDVDREVSKEMTSQINKPFSLTIVEGRVTEMEVEPTDATWSVNFKKGFASMLQMNTQCDEVEKSELDMWKSDLPHRFDDFKTMNNGKVCQVLETDVLGECKTTYSIESNPSSPGMKEVSKSRDLNDCERPLLYMEGPLSLLTFISMTRKAEPMVVKSSWTNYKLRDNVINSIRQESIFSFKPTAMESGSADTTIIQLLTLERSKSIDRPVRLASELQPTRRGLMYEFPSSVLRQHEEYELRSEELSNEEKVIEVERMLEAIIKEIHPTLDASAVQKVKALPELLKSLAEEDLLNLCRKYAPQDEDPEKTRKGDVLLDMLPTLNAGKAFKVLVQLTTSRMIREIRALVSLKAASLSFTPNVGMLDFLTPRNSEFMAHPTITNSPILRRAVWVSVPAMINRMLQQARNEGYPPSVITDRTTTFVEQMKQLYERSDTKEDKFAIIHGMGNSGLPALITFLEGICMNKEESSSIRFVCLKALAKMPRDFTMRRQQLFSMIYMDSTDQPSVRMQAFISLFDEKPERDIISMVINAHNNEDNGEMICLVYSYLTTLTNAELPGFRNMSESLLRIRPLVKSCETWLPSSVAGHFDYYSKQHRMGMGVDVIKTESSHERSEIVTRWMLNAFGQTTTPFELGVSTSGVTQLMHKMFGMHSHYDLYKDEDINDEQSWNDKSIKDMMKHWLTPLKHEHIHYGDVADDILSVVNKLKIADRPTMSDLEQLSFRLYISDTFLVDMTAKDIMQLIETGRSSYFGDVSEMYNELRSGKTIDFLRIMNAGCSTVMMPTPAGLPLSVNVTVTGVMHTTGRVQINAPSFTDLFHRAWSSNMPNHVSGSADLKPSLRSEIVLTTGVNCGLIQTGIAVQCESTIDLNFKVNGKFDTQEKKITTFVEGSNDAMRLKHETSPKVYVATITPSKKVKPVTFETLPLSHSSYMEMVEFDIPARLPVLNSELMVKCTVPVNRPNWLPVTWLWAPSTISVSSSPIQSTPSKFEIFYESESGEPQIRKMLPSTIDLNQITRRSSGEPRIVKFTMKLGPEGSQDKTCAWMFSMVYTPKLDLYMLTAVTRMPTLTDKLMSANLLLVPNGFRPSELRRINPEEAVMTLDMRFGQGKTVIRLFPDQSDEFSWDMYRENNFFRLIESYTKTPITSRVIKAVQRSPAKLLYKLRIETDIDTDRLSDCTKKILSAVGVAEYLKSSLPVLPASLIKRFEQSPSTTMQGQLLVVPSEQKIVIDVVTSPGGKQFALSVPRYLYTPISKLISLHPAPESRSYPDSYKSLVSNLWKVTSGECVLHKRGSSEEITTFDKRSFTIPPLPSDDCELLLTMDCAHRKFTVLIKPTANSNVLQVLIPSHKIEIVPGNKLRLVVDDREISLEDNQSKTLIDSRSRSEYAKVIKAGGWIHLHAEKYQLVLSTNGKDVVVKTSGSMKNNLCGLCGNFDNKKSSDLLGPDMYPSHSDEVMISKYVVDRNGGRCTPKSVRSHFGVTEIASESCDRREERTEVKKWRSEVCFSTHPVMKCPENCKPVATKTVRRSFHCRRSNIGETQRLVRKSLYEVLDDMKYKEKDEEFEVEVPTECAPWY